jgi:AcrR family transcriptional regulator
MTAGGSTTPRPPDDADGQLPAWKRQSVDRSLQSARVRAQERTDRFVAAAIELIKETGGTGFTVQDVVDRARMSIRTFYGFFESKDDLLAAVHATVLADEVEPRLRLASYAESDPVGRIRAYVFALHQLPPDGGAVSKALTIHQHRLAETRPADLDRAVKPQIDLVAELVAGAADAGRLRPGIDITSAALILHHLVLTVVQAQVLGDDPGVSAEDVWKFCAAGLGVDPIEGPHPSGEGDDRPDRMG